MAYGLSCCGGQTVYHAAGTRLIRLRVHSISFRVVIVYHSACAYGLSCCGGHTVYHSARTWLIIRRGTWSTFGGVIVYQIAGGLHHQAAGTRLIIRRGIRSIIRRAFVCHSAGLHHQAAGTRLIIPRGYSLSCCGGHTVYHSACASVSSFGAYMVNQAAW